MDTLKKGVPVNVSDYRRMARRALPKDAWEFISGGSGDRLTMRANRLAFSDVGLKPRVLVDVSRRTTGTAMLGADVAAPIAVAPMAYHCLADPAGEAATARAAAGSGLITVISSFASRTIEDVAAVANGSLWLQLYCFRDRDMMAGLVRRAEAAGYRALVLTIDMPMMGTRDADARNRFTLPRHVTPVNLLAAAPADGSPIGRPNVAELTRQLLDDGVSWELVRWLRSISALPLVLKGILTADDAALAVDCGAAGVIVSNHGGRQLDGAVAGMRALPEVVARVGRACEVYVDGGVRRGADVLKALALGARAVLVGRPVLWGLAAGGEAGVSHVLRMIREELDLAMALSGCPTVDSVRQIGTARLWSQ
jgi:4-hydroxymandelate oxidase